MSRFLFHTRILRDPLSVCCLPPSSRTVCRRLPKDSFVLRFFVLPCVMKSRYGHFATKYLSSRQISMVMSGFIFYNSRFQNRAKSLLNMFGDQFLTQALPPITFESNVIRSNSIILYIPFAFHRQEKFPPNIATTYTEAD